MVTYDDIWTSARALSPDDKARLLQDLSAALRRDLADLSSQPKPSLYGAFRDLGPAPSADDIDDARREMWRNFPREDI